MLRAEVHFAWPQVGKKAVMTLQEEEPEMFELQPLPRGVES